MSEKTYAARVEVRPKPEVGDDPQVIANNRQLSGVYSDLEWAQGVEILEVGRLVEFDISAGRKRDARRRAERLSEELLANRLTEDATVELELKEED